MKIAVLILSTLVEPSTSNIKAIKDTYVSLANKLQAEGKLKHTYDFYFYYGGFDNQDVLGGNEEEAHIVKDVQYKNCYDINISIPESVYKTYEKGIISLKEVNGYDWYVRCNISCYLNIPVLDKIINGLDFNTVYCNALNTYINDEKYYNDIYPRGDFMMFYKSVREGILKNSDKYWGCDELLEDRINIPHVDDCLIGLTLIDYFGNDYYKHLQMFNYNFLPQYDAKDIQFNSLLPTSRVKTIPPGLDYSGYSWKDNQYRRVDIEKMELINNSVANTDYTTKTISVQSVITNARDLLGVQFYRTNLKNIHEYLKQKRGSN